MGLKFQKTYLSMFPFKVKVKSILEALSIDFNLFRHLFFLFRGSTTGGWPGCLFICPIDFNL